MEASRRTPKTSEPSPDSSGAGKTHVADITKLRDECLTKLNDIASKVQQLSSQACADVTRAINDVQFAMEARQRALFREYASSVQRASTSPDELHDITQRCSSDLDTSLAEAHKSVGEAQEKVRSTLQHGIQAANQEWDLAGAQYVSDLQRRLSQIDGTNADPALLASIGQSLLWIASLMRRKAG